MVETKYSKYLLAEPGLRRKAFNPKIVKPKAVLQSGTHFNAGNITICWECVSQPMVMDPIPHSHDYDEYLSWMGGNAEDVFDFDAEIDIFLGEEGEKHIINKSTVLYLPAGLVHCPINYKRIGKPILFNVIAYDPAYYDSSTTKTFFVRKGEREEMITEARSKISQYDPTRTSSAYVEQIKAFLEHLENSKDN
jgi:hypothetical protein